MRVIATFLLLAASGCAPQSSVQDIIRAQVQQNTRDISTTSTILADQDQRLRQQSREAMYRKIAQLQRDTGQRNLATRAAPNVVPVTRAYPVASASPQIVYAHDPFAITPVNTNQRQLGYRRDIDKNTSDIAAIRSDYTQLTGRVGRLETKADALERRMQDGFSQVHQRLDTLAVPATSNQGDTFRRR